MRACRAGRSCSVRCCLSREGTPRGICEETSAPWATSPAPATSAICPLSSTTSAVCPVTFGSGCDHGLWARCWVSWLLGLQCPLNWSVLETGDNQTSEPGTGCHSPLGGGKSYWNSWVSDQRLTWGRGLCSGALPLTVCPRKRPKLARE